MKYLLKSFVKIRLRCSDLWRGHSSIGATRLLHVHEQVSPSADEAKQLFKDVIGEGKDCVIKAMDFTGARDLGHISNGSKYGVHICNEPGDIEKFVSFMITKQTTKNSEEVVKQLANLSIEEKNKVPRLVRNESALRTFKLERGLDDAIVLHFSTVGDFKKWVRANMQAYHVSDFEVVHKHVVLNDVHFSRLPLTQVHDVHVKSLSRLFSDYTTFDLVFEYMHVACKKKLHLHSLNLPQADTFSKFTPLTDFYADALCTDLRLYRAEDREMKARDFINGIVKCAMRVVNESALDEGDGGAGAIGGAGEVELSVEPNIAGSRARGKLDLALYYHHCIVLVVKAIDSNFGTEPAAAQLCAQLIAVREEFLRSLVKTFPHIDPKVIRDAMAEMPSCGVATTAVNWAFVHYHSIGKNKWVVEVSDDLPLFLPYRPTPAVQSIIKDQVKTVVLTLAGLLKKEIQAIEHLLAKLNAY